MLELEPQPQRSRRVARIKRRSALRRRRRIFAAACLAVLIVVILACRSCLSSQEPVYPDLIGQIPVITDLLPEGHAGRPGMARKIRWIVIHETGNSGTGANAKSHNSFLHSEPQYTQPLSWHYTVDDHEIYHHLPDTEVGWHAGDSLTKKGGNQCGIGVEICINQDGDFDQAVDNAAQLTAYLLKAYGLKLDDVKQHGDFMAKDCPTHLRQDDNWQKFLEKIKQYRQAL